MTLQRGLAWVQKAFDVIPIWTVEPDISVVMATAQPHLPRGTPYTVSPFAAGAFNKLFLLSPDETDRNLPSFILRVALPVDPYLKTASEVATLSYLSNHTSIPVPKVIAYDASAENDLGFEWILMTRLPGVPLKELWSTALLTSEERVRITEQMSGYIRQMQVVHFNRTGSLYQTPYPREVQHHQKRTKVHSSRVRSSVLNRAYCRSSILPQQPS